MADNQFPGQRPPDWQPPQGGARKGPHGCLIAAAVLGGLIVLSAIFGGDRPGVTGGTGADPATPPAPAIKVSARDLFAAYAANEVAAQAAYGKGPLEVSGTVHAIELDISDDPVVRFDVGESYNYVSASFPEEAAGQTSALTKGQKLTVRCASVRELAGTPYLHDCALAP